MKKASLLLFVVFLVSACKKNEDNNVPTITQFKINGEELAVSVNAGSDMQVAMEFSDDKELNQYRLEFSSNFNKANGFDAFSYLVVNNLSGSNSSAQLTIPVPGSALAGPYEAYLDVIDKKGNESATSTMALLILNTNHQPLVNITSPDLSQNFQIPKGDTLALQGQISDDQDLNTICIWLEADLRIYDEVFDLGSTVLTTWDLAEIALQNKWIIIPSTAETGEYELVVRAEDNDEHITVHQATITVVD